MIDGDMQLNLSLSFFDEDAVLNGKYGVLENNEFIKELL